MDSDKKLLLANLSPKLRTIRKSETEGTVAKIWDINNYETAPDVTNYICNIIITFL